MSLVLGLESLWNRGHNEILVSDGGGGFERAPRLSANWISQVSRVFGIIHDQPSRLRTEMLLQRFRQEKIAVSPNDQIGNRADGVYWSIHGPARFHTDVRTLAVSTEHIARLAGIPTRFAALDDCTIYRIGVLLPLGVTPPILATFVAGMRDREYRATVNDEQMLQYAAIYRHVECGQKGVAVEHEAFLSFGKGPGGTSSASVPLLDSTATSTQRFRGRWRSVKDGRGLVPGWIHDWRRKRNAAATVIGVMDRDNWTARTDNIVVVEFRRRRLFWIPRDLWSDVVRDRINEAFGRGGHQLFLAAVREVGLPAESSVILLRSAVEQALDGLRVTVPVDRPMRFWYPLEPTQRLEDGGKLIGFDPPKETLVGERIHQWVGARRSADKPLRLPDLDRIERQQILIGRLLEEGYDFWKALNDSALVAMSSATALQSFAVGGSRHGWSFRTYPKVEPATIDGKAVVVRRRRALRLPCRAPRDRR